MYQLHPFLFHLQHLQILIYPIKVFLKQGYGIVSIVSHLIDSRLNTMHFGIMTHHALLMIIGQKLSFRKVYQSSKSKILEAIYYFD
jgi:hypothetical protein